MSAPSAPRGVEAIILAGGAGTRMRPLSATCPKPLLPVAGVAVLVHQLRRLADVGVGHVVLATSYRADDVAALGLDALARDLGIALTRTVEETPLGTGGGVRAAFAALPDGPGERAVVVVNGDLLSGHDLRAQLQRLERADPSGRRPEAVVHTRTVSDARAFGCVLTDDDGRVTAFIEKSPDPPSDVVNAGTYVARRRLLEALPTGRALSLEREVLPRWAAEGVLSAHAEQAEFWDVGSPATLVAASAALSRRLAATASRQAGGRPGPEAVVAPEARIGDCAVLDDGSSVLAGAVVGAEAVVRGSIVMAGAEVGPGALVRDSALAPGARVGAHARVSECALGAGAIVLDGAVLHGRHLEPGATWPGP